MDEIKKDVAIELVRKEAQKNNAEGFRNENTQKDSIKMADIAIERLSTKTALELKEYRDLIEMRSKWSNGVLALLVFIVFSDVFFAWALGFGLISFSGNWTVPIFVGDGLLKTIGLALIVVQFLFSKESFNKKTGLSY